MSKIIGFDMVPDNYDLFRDHEARMEEEKSRLPTCDCCGEPTYVYYDIFGTVICPDCIDDFKHVEEVY